MRVVVTQFVTLDGVSQGPGSATEDPSGGFDRGGWLIPYFDDAFIERTSEWLDRADGLLFGRRTYEAFARDWPSMTEADNPFAARMNGLPKYVVTNTLANGDWHPTTVLRGDPVAAVEAIKSEAGNELQVHGSARLGHTLLAHGLVDALRLVVAPTIIGSGRRLLTEMDATAGLRLVDQAATATGLVMLEYERLGEAPRSAFEESDLTRANDERVRDPSLVQRPD